MEEQVKQTGSDSQDAISKYAHLLKGETRKQAKEASERGQIAGVFNNKDLEAVFEELDAHKKWEEEARQEVLKLQDYIRK